ncbi:SCO family protein [Streptomonospora wellingtoniae]|uniref:SCO family protein n=1 Tax=Streptomonospora wellingtoniae TaxID=3075544 RepID=A0ABU2KTU1_9ACTN|nr:SCO family protein [Streptomonospora sp. DSM 45055]MDT0302606.1 SCO family protein [Streptomonospora sp. DSM 45055]
MSERQGGVRRCGLGAAAVAAAAVIAVAGCGTGQQAQGKQGTQQREGPFLEVSETAMPAPQYEFSTARGEPWAFGDVAGDRLTLLYFGYTSCPDVCPTTMADIDAALQRMGGAAEDFDVVMVSTDPERDTDVQLRAWLNAFNPEFTGVRGPIDEVVEAARAYGIPVEKPETTDGDYQVSHGGRVAVLDGEGAAVGFFDEGTAPGKMSDVLPGLAEERL